MVRIYLLKLRKNLYNQSVKLLGTMMDNKLNCNDHVSNICRKVSLKLHALARVSHYMNRENFDLS